MDEDYTEPSRYPEGYLSWNTSPMYTEVYAPSAIQPGQIIELRASGYDFQATVERVDSNYYDGMTRTEVVLSLPRYTAQMSYRGERENLARQLINSEPPILRVTYDPEAGMLEEGELPSNATAEEVDSGFLEAYELTDDDDTVDEEVAVGRFTQRMTIGVPVSQELLDDQIYPTSLTREGLRDAMDALTSARMTPSDIYVNPYTYQQFQPILMPEENSNRYIFNNDVRVIESEYVNRPFVVGTPVGDAPMTIGRIESSTMYGPPAEPAPKPDPANPDTDHFTLFDFMTQERG